MLPELAAASAGSQICVGGVIGEKGCGCVGVGASEDGGGVGVRERELARCGVDATAANVGWGELAEPPRPRVNPCQMMRLMLSIAAGASASSRELKMPPGMWVEYTLSNWLTRVCVADLRTYIQMTHLSANRRCFSARGSWPKPSVFQLIALITPEA